MFCRLPSEKEECGDSSVTVKGFIFQGHQYPRGKWPWLVAIKHNNKFECGGSLISENLVITGRTYSNLILYNRIY